MGFYAMMRRKKLKIIHEKKAKKKSNEKLIRIVTQMY